MRPLKMELGSGVASRSKTHDGTRNFESLHVLFDIIREERSFRIQIITLEALETFESVLKENRVEYMTQFSSKTVAADCIVLILGDSSVDVSAMGRYILFSNIRHKEFVQIVFCPTFEEKLLAIGDEYIVRAYNYKNIRELQMLTENRSFGFNDCGRGLDYFESVVMLVGMSRSRFRDILEGVREMDSGLGNPFLLQMKLNGLVDKLFMLRSGDRYRINVSGDTLRSIRMRIGLCKDGMKQTA